MKIRFGNVLYIKGRIGWQRLSKDEYLEKGDYYLITGVDITDEHRIDYSKCYFVSKDRYDKDDKIQLKNGDIIVTKDGTIGKIAIIDNLDKPATLNSHLFLIRNNRPDILDTEYLFYILRSDYFQKFALNNTSGSNIPAFTQENISNFEMDLPILEEQKKIANILSLIDSKIRLNNSICKDLEAMAKQIYDYWFVQFDFPDENGKPYKSSGGKMVWNEELNREIPKCGEVKSIQNLGIYVSDFTANGSFAGLAENVKYNEGEKYAILVRSVDFSNGFSPLKYVWVNKHGYDYLQSCHLYGGEIIIINVGAVGDTYRVPLINEKMVLGPNGLVIKANQYDDYLYCFLKSAYGNLIINYMASGSVQRKFNKTDFRNMKLFIPPKTVLDEFNIKYKPIRKMMDNIWLENRELIELRDFLLPLLMNGQVSVE